MHRSWWSLILLVLVVGGALVPLSPHSTPQPEPPSPLAIEVVAQGLEVPWALAFAPDGRLFLTERPGRVRVVEGGRLREEAWAVLPVAAIGEGGLMGIALDPLFPAQPFIYLCYTYRRADGSLANRIVRLQEQDGRGINEQVLVDNIPGADIHNGCRLKFGPDGMLWATTGDARRPDLSQDPTSLAGKVLRMQKDGSPPSDNPFLGSLVYTLGHRNPQGLAFHPRTGEAWITEHGPIGNDEVNRLTPGANYGWPRVQGRAGDPRFADPVAAYTPSIAPAGATFLTSPRYPQWRGDFLFVTLGFGGGQSHLRRLDLDDAGTLLGQEALLTGVLGRLRDIVEGPDGYLYITTSNRDGRASPRPGDDKVVRLVPDPAPPAETLPVLLTPTPTAPTPPPEAPMRRTGASAVVLIGGILGAGAVVGLLLLLALRWRGERRG
ncbi:MAG: PQQ-dependent sugar dehydrogenase [Dehalococcoidia bacterium]|nr:PQQ-dependent sugar dehydrogenase [Dehalococcoidia bacterium]MDW8120265.1 PQQ-dependent sugar dehydrogenase [Chloroflexota bacterium]